MTCGEKKCLTKKTKNVTQSCAVHTGLLRYQSPGGSKNNHFARHFSVPQFQFLRNVETMFAKDPKWFLWCKHASRHHIRKPDCTATLLWFQNAILMFQRKTPEKLRHIAKRLEFIDIILRVSSVRNMKTIGKSDEKFNGIDFQIKVFASEMCSFHCKWELWKSWFL